jgi:hypothetical protein
LIPVLILVASFGIASTLLPQMPLRNGAYPRPIEIPAYPRQKDDAFFVTNGSEELSHIALYHGIGSSIEHARQADILLIGNSRQQTGLLEEVINEEARKLGLKTFTIATGHADKTRFALELIRKHDLKPLVLIASGGPFVFTEGLSPWAREVMAMSTWDARKRFWERSVAWSVKSNLHQYLPRLDFFNTGPTYPWIHYRSEETGWWRNALEPAARIPVSIQTERKSYRFTLPLARELKQELDQRGTLLVLTIVPYLNTRSGHLSYLSRELGVPYILPSFDDMQTADGSHLDHSSALNYSREFWQSFVVIKEVRKKLSLE